MFESQRSQPSQHKASALFLAGLIASTGSTLTLAGDHSGGEPSVRLTINALFPDEDDNWESDVGIQVQGIFKPSYMPAGTKLGLMVGTVSLDADDAVTTFSAGDATSAQLTGDVQITQIGASIFKERELSNMGMGHLEAGLIYQIVSTDTDITYTYSGGETLSDEVDFDNVLTLSLGADISTPMSSGFTAFAGVGYQFDLIQSEADAFGDKVEQNFDGFSIRAGIQFEL